MRSVHLPNAKVESKLYWQCVCVCANPALYDPSPRERQFLARVIRAHDGNRRLRLAVQSIATGIIRTCKQRQRLRQSSQAH